MRTVSAQNDVYQDRSQVSRWRVEKPNGSNSLGGNFRRGDPQASLDSRPLARPVASQFETRSAKVQTPACLEAGFVTQVLLQVLGVDRGDPLRAAQAYAAALQTAPSESFIRSL